MYKLYKLFIFFFFFLFSTLLNANNESELSGKDIKTLLSSPDKFDSAIVWLKRKNELHQSHILSKYESELNALANSLKTDEQRFDLYMELGNHKLNMGDFEEALKHFETAYSAAEKLDDPNKIAKINQTIAAFYAVSNQPVKSISYFLKAKEFYRKSSNYRDYSFVLINTSVAYLNIGDYETAVNHLLEAEASILSSNKEELQGESQRALMNIYLNLGEAYRELNQPLKAKENYYKSLEIAKNRNDTAYISNSYNNLGIVYMKVNPINSDSSFWFLRKSIELHIKMNRLPALAKSYTNLASTFLDIHQYDSAKHYFYMVDSISKAINLPLGIYYANDGLSGVYFDKKNVTKSLEHQRIAYEIASRVNNLGLLRTSAKKTAELWEKIGNSDSALYYLKTAEELNSEIEKIYNQQRIDEMLTRYESEVKEKENALLRVSNTEISAQAERRKLFLIGTAIIALALVLFLIFLYRSYAVIKKLNNSLEKSNQEIVKQNKALNQLNKDFQEKNTELDELNKLNNKLLRIISHDMRSPLASLSQVIELILTDTLEQEKARWMLEKLQQDLSKTTDLLNNLLNWAKSQLEGLKLNPEPCDILKSSNETVSLYDWWVKEKSINVVNKLPKDVRVLVDENMFKLILRNFYTNAIKFSQLGGTIELVGEKGQGNTFKVGIRDFGVGMNKEKLESLFKLQTSSKGTANELGTGLGLYLSNEAAVQSGGRVYAESTPNEGSTFWVELPLA